MSSQRRLDASQANARLSSGPQTPAKNFDDFLAATKPASNLKAPWSRTPLPLA